MRSRARIRRAGIPQGLKGDQVDFVRVLERIQDEDLTMQAAEILAYRLPPKIVYFAAIRLGAHATVGEYESQIVPDLLFMDAVRRWDEKKIRRKK
jgi:hypothetical protein